MADLKISELTNLTAADPANDMIPIVDVSATPPASGSTKRISINNILACSPTATLASATISGDLTVDTSTLKVDSANNRVGIGTATPNFALLEVIGGDMRMSLNQSLYLYYGSATNYASLRTDNSGNVQVFTGLTSPANRFQIANDGICTWSNVGGVAGTAMTLNSTGLGVGTASLSRKFEVHGTPVTIGGTATGMLVTVANNGTAYNASPTSGFALWNKFNSSGSLFPSAAIQAGKENATDGNYAGFLSLYTVNSVGSPNEQMRIDSSGNVGIGVTPSAWQNTVNALQVGTQSSVWQYSSQTFITNNRYFDGANKFIGNGYSLTYNQNPSTGEHVWFNTTNNSSGAGAALSPIQAMTLESTGSLVLGAAAVATTATDGFLYIPGCAGTPTGTPTAKTGRVPLVVDTTNNKLYFYSGGAWVAAN